MTVAATHIYLDKTVWKTMLPWGIKTTLNSTYNFVPSDASHSISHLTKTDFLKINNKLNRGKMSCLCISFRGLKDHTQQCLYHLWKIWDFLVVSVLQLTKWFAFSQSSRVMWYNPPLSLDYFSKDRKKNLQVADF